MKRRVAAALFLAAVFACFSTLKQVGQVGFGALAGSWLVFFAAWAAAAFLLLSWREGGKRAGARPDRLLRGLPGGSLPGRLAGRLQGTWPDRHFLPAAWIGIFVCWLPAWLALFPGVYGYDAPIQMEQFFGYAALTSHHPVAHTYLLGGFLTGGKRLFGSYEAGLALFTLAQGLAVSGSLACSLAFLKRRGAGWPVLLPGFATAAFHPVIQALSFNCTKDTLFGAFFVYFALAFWQAAEEEGQAAGRLILSGFLMCLFRNQGIYILLALLLLVGLAAFLSGPQGKRGLYRTAGGLLAAFLLAGGVFLFFSHGLKIPAGDKREMLSVPMQQAACIANRALAGKEANISGEQLEAIGEVIPEENVRAYLPVCADPVKDGFRTDVLTQDPGRYAKTWFDVGRQNPGLYLAAFKELIYPYWDMASNPQRGLCLENTFPGLDGPRLVRRSLFAGYESYLRRAVAQYDYHALPPLSWLLQPGLCLWLAALAMGFAIGDGNGRRFLAMMPAALYFGTLLLGPVALLRYLYPLLLCQPLFWGMCFKVTYVKDRSE